MKLHNPEVALHAASALVLGLGASGMAAADLLVAHGVAVTAIDSAADDRRQQAARTLAARGVDARTGVATLPEGSFGLCVVSPGIPCTAPWVRAAQARGIETIAELELGARCCAAPVLAVTGTNGKSTVVKLCGELIGRAGKTACVGGNYGPPLCRLLVENPEVDWVVLEVSSFQMELESTLRPRVAVLLNVQPDHLDRHESPAAYLRLKARLFERLRAPDVAIVHAEAIEAVRAQVGQAPRWVSFGTSVASDYAYLPGRVARDGVAVVTLTGTDFDNPVLGQSAAAVAAVGDALGIDPAFVAATLRQFEPLAHRVQVVGKCGGVTFVDDSKATNLAAMRAALGIVRGPVRLIAGGLLKEKDLDGMQGVLAKRVASVYSIGDAAPRMHAAWEACVPVRRCGDLSTAVAAAWADAVAGDVVLLSPGCASFDQFESYKDRGEQFKKQVEGICHAENAS
jgi:UDP-N-acetylmuramoylalanine--D-glutamate ligase